MTYYDDEVITMNKRQPKKSVSVLLPIDLYDRLKACAAEDIRPLSGEIRQILKGYVEYIDRGGVSWCSDWHNRGVERYEEPS